MADQPDPRDLLAGPHAGFEFRLFGRFAARDLRDGCDATPRGRKARALLAYLLIERAKVSRDRLAGLLWSERAQAQAHASLRQCLLELRPFVQGTEPLLVIGRTHVELAGAFTADLDQMALAAATGDPPVLAALLAPGTQLLEDLDGVDPSFDEWLGPVRARQGDMIAALTRDAAADALASGRAEDALRLAHEALRIDPLDEGAARTGMAAAAVSGQKQVGHRIYQALEAALRQELGTSPERETRAALERLRREPADSGPASSAPAMEAEPRPAAPETAIGQTRRRWRIYAAAAMALLAVATIGFAATRWFARPDIPTIAVTATQDGFARELADGVAIDVGRLAGARVGEIALVEPADDPDLLVRIGAERAGDMIRANVGVTGRGSSELLWSTTLEHPVAQAGELRLQLAAKIGSVLLCGSRAQASGADLDPAGIRLFLSACDRSDEIPDRQLVALLRQLTARAPGFGYAWAMLAAVESDLRQMEVMRVGPAGSSDELGGAAREHLLRARALGAEAGPTFVAEALLLPPDRWAEILAVVDRGIALDPDYPQLHDLRSEVLYRIGLLTDAITAAERAAQLNPLSPEVRGGYVTALAHAGNIERARRELDQAEQIWPSSEQLKIVRFSVELRYGDARRAQQMIERGEASLAGRAGSFGGQEIMMQARLEPTPANVAAIVQRVAEARRFPGAVATRLQALGQFGAVEEVYQLLDREPAALERLRDATDVLFRPHMKGVRDDRRFMELARRLGLLQHWRTTNLWPDFCSDPRLPYECRAEGARILGGR